MSFFKRKVGNLLLGGKLIKTKLLYLLITRFSGQLGKELTGGEELPEERGQLVPKVNSSELT